MAAAPILTTSRLLLRGWQDSDLAPFAAMNADPRVMEFFPHLLTRAESDAAVAKAREHFARHGFGKWVIEIPGSAPFIGYAGLAVVDFPAPFAPAIEIGWRLAHEHWSHGYATEAAGAILDFAFNKLNLTEIVSFTVPANTRSRAVMHRLGMTHNPAEDFDHPNLPDPHPLRRHVLNRLRRSGSSTSAPLL